MSRGLRPAPYRMGVDKRAVFDARNDPRRARRIMLRTAALFRRWAAEDRNGDPAGHRDCARELVRLARLDFRTRRGFRQAAKP